MPENSLSFCLRSPTRHRPVLAAINFINLLFGSNSRPFLTACKCPSCGVRTKRADRCVKAVSRSWRWRKARQRLVERKSGPRLIRSRSILHRLESDIRDTCIILSTLTTWRPLKRIGRYWVSPLLAITQQAPLRLAPPEMASVGH